MKKVLTIVLLISLVATCVFAQAAGEKKDEVYKIMLTCSNTAGKPHTDALIEACEVIKQRTDGKVIIEFHGGNEMFTGAEGIEAVMNNANVMYLTDANTFQDYYPPYATLTAPFLFNGDYKQAEAFLATDFWKGLEKEAEAAGIHSVINDLVLGTRNILASRAVYTLDDCAKLNIRVPDNATYINIFKSLGSNYLALSTSDMVTAMSTGMCDAMEGTAASAITYVKSIKTPHYTLDGHLMSIVGVHTGAGFWASLPEEYRNIITEEFEKAASKSNRTYAEQFDEYLARYEAEGCPVIRLTDEQKAAFVAAITPYAVSLPRYEEFKKVLDGLKY